MSPKTFKQRMVDNVPGKFYVGDQCLDCDLCRKTAPENFARNKGGAYSYVKKQPETADEEARCREAMAGCCTNTSHDDGNNFDWAALPAPTPDPFTNEPQKQQAQRRKLERGLDCQNHKKHDAQDQTR